MAFAARRHQPEPPKKPERARDIERRRDMEDGEEEGRMGFLDHLEELRTRIIRACIAVAIGMVVAFLMYDKIGEIVLSSVMASLPPGTNYLVYTRPGEGFSFYLDLSLIGGVILAAPFVAWQAWKFIAPGLYVNERRLVVPFVLLAVTGTIAGAVFSHYVLFPSMMMFFRSFESAHMKFLPRVEDTFDLYKNTMIGMVLVFQIPTIVYVLARIGFVTPRLLWHHLKHAILGAVIVAAVLTPSSDPWNQLVFAAPIVAMYLIGIAIAWVVQPRRKGEEDADNRSAMGLLIATAAFEKARARRKR
jgi:sec-independent protein translocase protein TatC